MPFRCTLLHLRSTNKNVLRKSRPHMQKYKELNRWQREAQGISKWDQSHSHRPQPTLERFNPESVGLSRGTSSFAWKWWYTQYPWLPNVPPDSYTPPKPQGVRPPAWDEEFTKAVLHMDDIELKSYLLDKLTEVIFNETQRDGYELRRLDFEGNPLTHLPEPRIIENFVFEQDSLRERILDQIVEGIFRLSPTSEDRKELRSVANIVDFVLTHVTAAREPPTNRITQAARAIMREHPLQPELGFSHALPTDNRDTVVREWERMHHLDWQFGNAVYEPRNTENTRGNLAWLREVRHHADREAFERDVASGEAKRRHMEKIKAACHGVETSFPDKVKPQRESLKPSKEEATTMGIRLNEQLKQLCFQDHEFGITLNTCADLLNNDEGFLENDDTVSGDSLNFDPLVMVEGKVSQGVSLEILVKDLTFFEDIIRDKISYCVNTDMRTAFLSVSTDLLGMQEELQYVQLPLESSIKKLDQATHQLLACTQVVQEKLNKAGVVEAMRIFDITFLKVMLSHEKIVQTMQKLMPQLIEVCNTDKGAFSKTGLFFKTATASATNEKILTKTHLKEFNRSFKCITPNITERFEAVAISMHQLNTLVSALPVLRTKQKERAEIYTRVQESRSSLLEGLGLAVKYIFCRVTELHDQSSKHQLQDLIKIYNTLDAAEDFCRMFSETVLYPYLENLLSWKATTQARQSVDEVVRLLELLRDQLKDEIVPLLPWMSQGFTGKTFFPVCAILWPTICRLVYEKFVTLFDIGMPESFHKRYTVSYRLLSVAEYACSTAEELIALRQSPSVVLWNDKWNTDIYGTLRVAEIDSAIAGALADLKKTVEPKKGIVNVFQVFAAQVQWLFSEDVVLSVCIPKFLRKLHAIYKLVLQEMYNYITSSVLKDFSEDGSAAQKNRCGVLQIVSFFEFIKGVLQVSNLLEGPLLSRLSHHQSCPALPLASITRVMLFIRDSVCQVFMENTQRLVVDTVLSECVPGLQNIKTVRSAYLHTKKPPPTSPSWYLSSVVDPIVWYVNSVHEIQLPDNIAKAMFQAIAERIVEQFKTIAQQTLITAKKTEESWEKLRRRKEASGMTIGSSTTVATDSHDSPLSSTSPSSLLKPVFRASPDGMTDREKMLLQLNLDAKALEEKLSSLGVETNISPLLEPTSDLQCDTESNSNPTVLT